MDAPLYGGACSCDSSCTILGDCCVDYQAECEAELTPHLGSRYETRAVEEYTDPCSSAILTTCAPGCYDSARGNGVCDAACKVTECNYDNGDCAAFAPAGWMCSPTLYGDGKCDCGSQCGVVDVDCVTLNNTGSVVHGCPWEGTHQQTCCTLINGLGVCALSGPAATCHRGNVPADWFCASSAWMDGVCDCECGAYDPDCQGSAAAGYAVGPANITGCVGKDACCADVAGYGVCSTVAMVGGERVCAAPPAPLNLFVESADLKLWSYDLLALSGGVPTRRYVVNATIHIVGASLVFFGEVVEVQATWTNDGTFHMTNSTTFTIKDTETTAVTFTFAAAVPGKAVALALNVDPRYSVVETTKADNVALGTMTLEPRLQQLYPLTNPGTLPIGLGAQEETYLALLPKAPPSVLLAPTIQSVYFLMTNGSAVDKGAARICTATTPYTLDSQVGYACAFDVTQWIGNVTKAHFLTAVAVADSGAESVPVFYSINPQEVPTMFQNQFNSTNLTGPTAPMTTARSVFEDDLYDASRMGAPLVADEFVHDHEPNRISGAPIYNHPGHLRMPHDVDIVPPVTSANHNRTRYHSRSFNGATADMSCTDFGGDAWKAIDGKGSPLWTDGTCAHSCLTKNPWLRVNFGSVQSINWVTLVNRADCCGERLSNFEIRIGNSPRNIDNPICNIVGSLGPGATTLSCVGTGQYLSLTVRGNSAAFLTVCEISWFRGVASMSSQFLDADASRAIDGKMSGIWGDKTCMSTAGTDVPWFRVDYGMQIPITRVFLWGRTDCCLDRLSNFDVRVGDSPTMEGNPICYHSDQSLGKDMASLPCAAVGRYLFVSLKRVEYLTICEIQVQTGRVAWKPELPSAATTGNGAGGSSQVDMVETNGVEVNGKCYKFAKKWNNNKKKDKKAKVESKVKANGLWSYSWEVRIQFEGCLNGAFAATIAGEGSAQNPSGIEAVIRAQGTATGLAQASSPFIQIKAIAIQLYGSLSAKKGGDYDIGICSISWEAELKIAAVIKVNLYDCGGCNLLGFRLGKVIPITAGAGVFIRADMNLWSIVTVSLRGQARVMVGFDLQSDLSGFDFKRWQVDGLLSAQGCHRWFRCWWLDCETTWKCYPDSPWTLSGKWGEGGTDGFEDLELGEIDRKNSGCIIDPYVGIPASYCDSYAGGRRQAFATIFEAAYACPRTDCYCVTEEPGGGSTRFTLRTGDQAKYSATGERSFMCKDFIDIGKKRNLNRLALPDGSYPDVAGITDGGEHWEYISKHEEEALFKDFEKHTRTGRTRTTLSHMDYLMAKHIHDTSFTDHEGAVLRFTPPVQDFMPHAASSPELAADEVLQPCSPVPSSNYLLRGFATTRAPLLTQLTNADLLFCYYTLRDINFTMFEMDHDTVCSLRAGTGAWAVPQAVPSAATTPLSAVTAIASAQALGAFVVSPPLMLQKPADVAAAVLAGAPSTVDPVYLSSNVTMYAREHFTLNVARFAGSWGPMTAIPGRGPRLGRLTWASRSGNSKELLVGVERAFSFNPFFLAMDQNAVFVTLVDPADLSFTAPLDLLTANNVTEDSISAAVFAPSPASPHQAVIGYVNPKGDVHLLSSATAHVQSSWTDRFIACNASEHVAVSFFGAGAKTVVAWAMNTSNANVNLTSTVTQYCIITGLAGACSPVTIPWLSALAASPARDMEAFSHHFTALPDDSLVLSWSEKYPGDDGGSYVRWAILPKGTSVFGAPQTTKSSRDKPILYAVAPTLSYANTDFYLVTAEATGADLVNATLQADTARLRAKNESIGDTYVNQLSIAPMVKVTALAYDMPTMSLTGTVTNLGATPSGAITVSLWGGDYANARLPLDLQTVLPATLKPMESANVTLTLSPGTYNASALLTGYVWMQVSDATAPMCISGMRVIPGRIRFADLELSGGADGHIQACGRLLLSGIVPASIPVNLTINRYNDSLKWSNDTQQMEEDGSVTTVLLGEAFSQADGESQEVCVDVQKMLTNLKQYAPPMTMNLNFPPDLVPPAAVQLVSLHFADLAIVDAGITLTALKRALSGSVTVFNMGVVVACRPVLEIFMTGAGQNNTLLYNTTIPSVPASGQVTVAFNLLDARILADVNITLHFEVNRRFAVSEVVVTNNAIHRVVIPQLPALMSVAPTASLTLTSVRRRDVSSGTTGVLTVRISNHGEGTVLLLPVHLTTGLVPGSPTLLPETIYYPSIAGGETVSVPLPFSCPGCRNLDAITASVILDPSNLIKNFYQSTRNTVYNVTASNPKTPAPPSPPSSSVWANAALLLTAAFWNELMTPQNIIITVFAVLTLVGTIVGIVVVCRKRRAKRKALEAKIAELEELSSQSGDMEGGWSEGSGSGGSQGGSATSGGSGGGAMWSSN